MNLERKVAALEEAVRPGACPACAHGAVVVVPTEDEVRRPLVCAQCGAVITGPVKVLIGTCWAHA